MNNRYPYLTDEQLNDCIISANKMVKNGTITKDEINDYLEYENNQHKPLNYSQWYSKQCF